MGVVSCRDCYLVSQTISLESGKLLLYFKGSLLLGPRFSCWLGLTNLFVGVEGGSC